MLKKKKTKEKKLITRFLKNNEELDDIITIGIPSKDCKCHKHDKSNDQKLIHKFIS